MPSLPVTGGAYISSGISAGVAYNIWDEPTTTVQAVWDSSGNQTTRTVTDVYDAAGRPSTSAIAATGSNTGQSLPTVTDNYYPLTGLPDTQSTGSGTITSVFDALGRQTGYQDANANTTCYYYDIDSRLAATIDSKTDSALTGPTSCPSSAPAGDATAYTYDNGNGALVAITDAVSGTAFYGSYDANGNLTSESLPNGISQNTTFNETDTPTSEIDLKFTSCVTACNWFTDTVQPTVHDQWATQNSTLSSQSYSYDQAARLTQVEDTVNGGRSEGPTGLLNASAGPTNVVTGPDGNLWVAEGYAALVAKITPSGTVTEYPTASGGAPMALTVGGDGNIWFADAANSAIGKITTSGTVTTYTLPDSNCYPTSIARGTAGTVVVTEYWCNHILVFNTTSHAWSTYNMPTNWEGPANIVQGSDGNDYFEDLNPNTHLEQVGEFNTTTNTITETALKAGSAPDTTWTSGPGEAAAAPGVIWAVDDGNAQLVEYNIANKTASYFNYPAGTTAVTGLTVAKDGTIWFTEGTTGKLGQLNPTTGAINQYQTSPATTSATGITQGPDGNIWFADWNSHSVYSLTTNTTAWTPAAGAACVTRQYAFDTDTNRTSLDTIPAKSGACDTTSSDGTTQNYTYDSADRLTASGSATPTYDPFGRITTLPASLADPAGQNALTSAFYVNDRIQQLNQTNQTISYTLDPALRIQKRTTVASGVTTYEDSYYDAAGDSPAWTQNVTSSGTPIANTWTRDIGGIDGNLTASQTSSATTLQLADLHGDIVGTASLTSTAASPLTECDATEYGVPRSGVGACTGGSSRYAWLGGKHRPTELPTGVIVMGARAYVPAIGAFLQADPIPGAGASAYGYANGDPINQSDLGGASAKTLKKIRKALCTVLVAVCGFHAVYPEVPASAPPASDGPTVEVPAPPRAPTPDDTGADEPQETPPDPSVLLPKRLETHTSVFDELWGAATAIVTWTAVNGYEIGGAVAVGG